MTRHLLLIGAQRCGTSYLRDLLDAHPDVAMARPARPEPKVFLSDERAGAGIGAYRDAYFGHAVGEQVLGEKSTSYLEDSRAPRRAAAVLGSPEILVVVRDPVARAASHWRFSTDNGLERRPLEEAVRADLVGDQPWDPDLTSVSPFAYARRGRYADFLGPWRAAFPGHVHVVFFEEITSDPEAVGACYAAIGVDPDVRPAGLGQVVNASPEPAASVPTELVGELRDYYADSDARLRSVVGRELPWCSAAAGVGTAR